ncbi:hypothetical protein ACIBHX_39575 [Nonomuraea sp. NPDC050536]|uniref:hypothetical protein n=1 Tax=Nonomuraea sp. NPDC050536 TaxID=3364366 RepID=UPI0037C73CD4
MDGQERWGMTAGGVGLAPGVGSAQASQLQVQCAMALQQLHGWLQTVVPRSPQLAEAVPLTAQAVRLYRAGQFEACLAQIQTVVAQIGRLGQQNRPSP